MVVSKIQNDKSCVFHLSHGVIKMSVAQCMDRSGNGLLNVSKIKGKIILMTL